MISKKNNISTKQRIECLKGWMASNKYIQENRKKKNSKKKKQDNL